MHLTNILFAIAGFILTVQSAPAPAASNANFIGPYNAVRLGGLSKRTSMCDTDGTTWVDRWSDGSAFRVHCERLAANIWGDGEWTLFPADGQRRLAKYESCAFGGWATGSTDQFVYIGNEDIRTIIWGSIDRFHKVKDNLDRVQAEGDMKCTDHPLNWGLYSIKGTYPDVKHYAIPDDKVALYRQGKWTPDPSALSNATQFVVSEDSASNWANVG
ncbi:putative necrosis-inducing factor-domain-containing protein [Cladorrhinum sp. PSN332]|nr:putative necrosis-inducing factor-domain-containing protein [Cladorrhinum sp. PSN332]